MQMYVLNMFNAANERSCFYFQTEDATKFPTCRFELEDLSRIDDSDDEPRWSNARKLFEDFDVSSCRLFSNAQEFWIVSITHKKIKI